MILPSPAYRHRMPTTAHEPGKWVEWVYPWAVALSPFFRPHNKDYNNQEIGENG